MQGAKFVENGKPAGNFFAWVGRGAFFSIECTKKRPKAFFYRMFLDVITVTALAGRPVGAGFKTVEAGSKTAGGKAFYAKK